MSTLDEMASGMPRRVIATCTPSLGRIPTQWAFALRNLFTPMNLGIMTMYSLGLPVAESRNRLIRQVLAMDEESTSLEISHVFWIDDDVLFQRGALVQLSQHRMPIVSGVYFSKSPPGEPLIFDGPLRGSAPFRPGEVREVWGHGMGLTLVETEVYRRLRDETELGEDENGNPAWYRTVQTEDGWRTTEDLYFLKAAHEIGIPSVIDQREQTFGWHYDLKTQRIYPTEQWDEWRKTQKVTWQTPEGPVVWEDLH